MNDDLTAWVTETAPRALAYAVSLVRNEAVAEDLVQDCYHRLLAKSGDYDLVSDGTKLLFKAIANACINWAQRKPPEISLHAIAGDTGPAVGPMADRPLQIAIGNELDAAVDAALAELPVAQRAVVELQVLGHSAAEVAEMLEMTQGNARVLLHRARQQLAEHLHPFLKNE